MIDNKELLERLEEIEGKLNDKVSSAHLFAMNTTGKVKEDAVKVYKDAVSELDGFLKNAKVQKQRLKLYVKSNKVLIACMAAAFFVGFVAGYAAHFFQ